MKTIIKLLLAALVLSLVPMTYVSAQDHIETPLERKARMEREAARKKRQQREARERREKAARERAKRDQAAARERAQRQRQQEEAALKKWSIVSEYNEGMVLAQDGYGKYDTGCYMTFLERMVEEYIGKEVQLNDGTICVVVLINKHKYSKYIQSYSST